MSIYKKRHQVLATMSKLRLHPFAYVALMQKLSTPNKKEDATNASKHQRYSLEALLHESCHGIFQRRKMFNGADGYRNP